MNNIARGESPIAIQAWSDGVFDQIEIEHGLDAAVRMRNIYQIIWDSKDKPLQDKLVIVNDTFNALPWVADINKWSTQDYWATPFETITQFGGDCEDMAIGKYMALRLIGVPEKNLHLAYVKVRATNETHMVLVWLNDDRSQSLVLDNLSEEIRSGDERTDLVAIYLTDASGNVILLNDDGVDKSIKTELKHRKLEKLETIKKRMRENQEKYKKYNNGRPLYSFE